MNLHTVDHIKTRLEFMQGYLEAHYDSDDGHMLSARLQELGAYMAESGKLKADMEFHYNEALNKELIQMIKGLLPEYSSASVQNKFMKSLAREENRILLIADRINRSCTHQIELMRTQLSFIKSLPK